VEPNHQPLENPPLEKVEPKQCSIFIDEKINKNIIYDSAFFS
jgi:hypothetical protein